MKHIKLLIVLCTATMLSACNDDRNNHSALVNQNVDSTSAQTMGGFVGNPGNDKNNFSISSDDRGAYEEAFQQAMESGKKSKWTSPASGHYGTIHPHHRYKNDAGLACRDFTQSLHIDGQRQQEHGKACKQSDGSWEIMQ